MNIGQNGFGLFRKKIKKIESDVLPPAEISTILTNETYAGEGTVVVYLGNGAQSQRFSKIFQKEGMRIRELSEGSGSNTCASLCFLSVGEREVPVKNGFSRKGCTFAGYTAARKEKGQWQWYTEEGQWRSLSADMPGKYVFREGESLSPILPKKKGLVILTAQWKGKDGTAQNCGYRMYHNPLMAHALGAFEEHTYCNTREAFQNSVKNGHQYFEADFSYTADRRLVLCHGWTEDQCKHIGLEYSDDFAHMTYDRLMKLKVHGHDIMDARDFYKLVKRYPKFSFELDLHETEDAPAEDMVKALLKDFQYDERALDCLLVQVGSDEMYDAIDQVYHFRHYQYKVGLDMERLDEVITFSLEHGICAVALRANFAKPEHIRKIKNAGLYVMCYTVGKSIPLALKFLEMGADTVCSDYIIPGKLLAYDQKKTFGRKPFYVYYHSSIAEITQEYTELIEEGALEGTAVTTAKGNVEYRDSIPWENDGMRSLVKNHFQAEGKRFAGWKLRISLDDRIFWYSTDGCFHTRGELDKCPVIQEYIFEDGDILPVLAVMPGMKLVMEAVWEEEV